MKDTPQENWQALMAAYCDLFITWDEAIAAQRKYFFEYHGMADTGHQHDHPTYTAFATSNSPPPIASPS